MWRGLYHVPWIDLWETEGLRGLQVESGSRGTVGQLEKDDHTLPKTALSQHGRAPWRTDNIEEPEITSSPYLVL